MNTPIHLNYTGGSGGFFALWVLLLGTDYQCIFDDETMTLDDIFNKQWNVDLYNWKDSEIHPNNLKTEQSEISNKLYFHCNLSAEEIYDQDGIRIVLYTDILTQRSMCKLKDAGIFCRNRDMKQLFMDMYNNIKDDSWDDINSLNDYGKLNNSIKMELNECVANSDQSSNSVLDIINDIEGFNPPEVTKLYSDIEVSELTYQILSVCDVEVTLGDMIKTNGNVLLSQLNYCSNDECVDFTERYIKFHPQTIRERLLS